MDINIDLWLNGEKINKKEMTPLFDYYISITHNDLDLDLEIDLLYELQSEINKNDLYIFLLEGQIEKIKTRLKEMIRESKLKSLMDY